MEKRTTDRLTKRLFVRFGVNSANNIGFTGNISGTGVFIKSIKVFPSGTYLVIEVTLPDEQIMRMRGRVVWAKRVPANLMRFVKKSGMGVFLDEIPDNYYAVLRQLG